MDGRNSSGARVSLLNDCPPTRPKLPCLPSLTQEYRRSCWTAPVAQPQAQPQGASGRHYHALSTSLALDPHPHSRTSSFASTPILSSPSTPQLVRSDSSDSAFIMNRTPSPFTPIGLGFDGLAVSSSSSTAAPAGAIHALHHHNGVALNVNVAPGHQPAYFPPMQAQGKGPSSHYPPISQHHPSPFAAYPSLPASAAGPLAFPPQHQLQLQQLHQQQQQMPTQQQPLQPHLGPASAPAPSAPSPSASGASKVPGKKNHYPCPLAKEYNCSNFFTTSGHAARHAKKHTGKKDAYCPECNKAFTRKDNMEQHRRTHQNGRNASKSSTGEAPAKRQKTSSTSSQPKRSKSEPESLETPTDMPVIDPSLPISPASSFGFVDASVLALPVQAIPQVYPVDLLSQGSFAAQPSPYPVAPYFDSSSMSGLDKLAMAASGESSRQNSGSL